MKLLVIEIEYDPAVFDLTPEIIEEDLAVLYDFSAVHLVVRNHRCDHHPAGIDKEYTSKSCNDCNHCVAYQHADGSHKDYNADPDAMDAASIIACYRELVTCGREKREYIVRSLKRTMKELAAHRDEVGP